MNDRKLHLIGNAHIDPVWLWRWQEGYAEVKATFRSALDRMNEFPEFVFTRSCAAYYQWIESNAPEMFEEIRQRVREGRWVIVGGWWIQPDCNIPSGESFARHGLISQRYFLEKFGVMARVGYNVDSFGHNGMLPQILKKSGMDYYVYSRPDDHEKDLPFNLFQWESADGSRVMTFKLPFNYNHGYDGFEGDMDDMPEWKGKFHETIFLRRKFAGIRRLAERRDTDMMAFYGVGNHGGGPTVRNLELIRELRREWGEDALFHSSPDAYFARMEEEHGELPVVRDDLQHNARGCYSAHSALKAAMRRAEHRALTAEKLSATAHALLGFPYPEEDLRQAWQRILFTQDHDILTGCSIKEAFDDTMETMGASLSVCAEVANAAMQKISWAVDTLGDRPLPPGKAVDWRLWEAEGLGAPLVVFNPLSWPVCAPIQVNRDVACVTDEAGNPLAIQRVRSAQMFFAEKWDTLFMAELPAMGYRVFRLYTAREFAADTAGMLACSAGSLENDWLRLEFDTGSGMLARLTDKRTAVEVLSPAAMQAIVLDETHCDTWAHGVDAFDREIGCFGNARLKLMESGPLRARVRSISTYGQSELRMDFVLYRHSPAVEIRVGLDWRERHRMLKFSFPVNVRESRAVTEIPYGFLARQADGGEEPGQQWLDVSGVAPNGRRCGLSLLNDSKYSYSVLGADMRLTAVRSPIYADLFGERDDECVFMDQGMQEFTLRLLPHDGDWHGAQTVRRAYELNVPPVQVQETYHRGPLPMRLEGIAIQPQNIAVTAFKRAEDDDGYILRCYETDSRAADASISVPLLGRQWFPAFGPCEIKTFFLSDDKNAGVTEKNLLEL